MRLYSKTINLKDDHQVWRGVICGFSCNAGFSPDYCRPRVHGEEGAGGGDTAGPGVRSLIQVVELRFKKLLVTG